MDEIDHAFRAAGVADGQWRLTDVVADGRGEGVYVPPDLVRDAAGQCEALTYKLKFDCAPFARREDGRVGVATGAGSYNPLYYAVVGWAGKPFEGATSLYVMRAASALLCALFLLGGLGALRAGRHFKVVWIATAAAVTPTVLYSTVVVAPNGVEMAAGFCFWAALLSLKLDDDVTDTQNRWLLALATLAGVVLVTVRTLGPLWACLIVLCVTLAQGRTASERLVLRHKIAFTMAFTTVLTGGLGALAWSGAVGLLTNSTGAGASIESSSGKLFDVHGWVFQTVAAFPFRDQPAPLAVYALVLIVVMAILARALHRTGGRRRAALLFAVGSSILVPIALVAVTREGQGADWQGRYALPFVIGVLLLASTLEENDQVRSDLSRKLFGFVAVSMLATAHVVSVADVQVRELGRDISSQDDRWLHPPTWATAAIMLAGWAVLTWTTQRSPAMPRVSA
jgi:hypothetical protein